MKRFHIHVGVKDLNESVKFYTTLFGHEPVKLKGDYAKWALEDPRLNFAISTRTSAEGVDHLGIQVENETELLEITNRLKAADQTLFDVGDTTCCYMEANKAWVKDPSGLAWEAYQNMNDAAVFGKDRAEQKPAEESCCAPEGLSKA
ncbi:glyoxalase/bleomycin resistance/dioxygenase family protein [bacterium]|nr:MAG: glyoxalase/bleomycin resistance/dioxygenase family protein [bacterium]